ncbi:serine/threonine-protein kinase [Sphingobium ummariense]
MTDGALPPDVPPPASGLADRPAHGEVRPGLILNGIYRVERAVARGGMGQVFEGTNVETDERVAIKVVHRHLASDSKVQAMFRKEARILTQLSHPAIAHYRVLARDPVVDVTYIVTDFIDGRPLLDLLNGQPATVADIQALGRRLADGLEAAHVAGAIHRDISPDTILIGEGGISEAKIIDFGIARDLAVGAETEHAPARATAQCEMGAADVLIEIIATAALPQ